MYEKRALVDLWRGKGWGKESKRERYSLLEGDFGQRDNGYEYDDEDGERLGIAIRFEDVGSYFVADFFAKHEHTGNSHA